MRTQKKKNVVEESIRGDSKAYLNKVSNPLFLFGIFLWIGIFIIKTIINLGITDNQNPLLGLILIPCFIFAIKSLKISFEYFGIM